MAYSESLAERVRYSLQNTEHVREINMFGGLCFMVNEKMCIGIMKDELMCRVDPSKMDDLLEHGHCKHMEFTGRPMKGFLIVESSGFETQQQLETWVNLCLAYNPMAKASKKK
jgi:TfoX/Sxy family transcriptional regulator of competence genes